MKLKKEAQRMAASVLLRRRKNNHRRWRKGERRRREHDGQEQVWEEMEMYSVRRYNRCM